MWSVPRAGLPLALGALLAGAAAAQGPAAGIPAEAWYAGRGETLFNDAFYRLVPARRHQEAARLFADAVREYRHAVSINPDYEPAWRRLARAHYVQKQYPEAAGAYREVLRLNPADVDVSVRLALTYSRLDRFDEAIAALDLARGYIDDMEALARLDDYIARLEQARAGQ